MAKKGSVRPVIASIPERRSGVQTDVHSIPGGPVRRETPWLIQSTVDGKRGSTKAHVWHGEPNIGVDAALASRRSRERIGES
jgi:hypothetical protein